ISRGALNNDCRWQVIAQLADERAGMEHQRLTLKTEHAGEAKGNHRAVPFAPVAGAGDGGGNCLAAHRVIHLLAREPRHAVEAEPYKRRMCRACLRTDLARATR